MKILFMSIATLIALPLFSQQTQVQTSQDQESDISSYQKIFLLPLEQSDKGTSVLKVAIPEGFKSIQPLEQFSKESETTIEYIPEGEDADHWSEIVTVHKFIGNKIPAIKFADTVLNQLLESVKSGKTITKKSSKKKSIEQAHFIAQYVLNNQQEIIGASFYSGPYDCAGVQYTIRSKKDQTDAAIKKIETYFKNQVRVETSP